VIARSELLLGSWSTHVTKISAIVGSAAPQRRLRSALEWLLARAFSPNGYDTDVIDLAAEQLLFEAGRSIKGYGRDAVRVVEKVVDADALVFASPVFDYFVPGALS
jgi:FMN reductase